MQPIESEVERLIEDLNNHQTMRFNGWRTHVSLAYTTRGTRTCLVDVLAGYREVTHVYKEGKDIVALIHQAFKEVKSRLRDTAHEGVAWGA